MDRRAIAWLVGIAAAAIVFVVWLLNVIRTPSPSPVAPASAEPSAAQREVDDHLARYDARVTEFLAALHGRRFADAHASMAAGYRATVSLERFEAGVADNAWFAGFRDVRIEGTRSKSGSTDAEGTLVWDGGNIRLVAHFVDDHGTPKLMGLSLGGSAALPSLAP